MAMGATKGISKDVKASAAVVQYTIAAPGADDDTFSTASAATNPLVGVFQAALSSTDQAAGKYVEVMVTGISYLALGAGGCARGNKLTSDANGNGVVATSGNQAIGIALKSGAQGDVIPVLLAPATA